MGSMSYLSSTGSKQTAGGAWLVEPNREGACIIRVIQVKPSFFYSFSIVCWDGGPKSRDRAVC
jgi:hypothetical protein